MNGDGTASRGDAKEVAIDRFLTATHHVALLALDSESPTSILTFMFSCINSLLSIVPESHRASHKWIWQCGLQNMLSISIIADNSESRPSILFAEVCDVGFNTELSAVLYAEQYGRWLISRGRRSDVADMIAIVARHVQHSHFVAELIEVEQRLQAYATEVGANENRP